MDIGVEPSPSFCWLLDLNLKAAITSSMKVEELHQNPGIPLDY